MHRQSNPNALVLTSSDLPGQAAANTRLSHQPLGEQGHLEPITNTFEVDIAYFHCREHRSFYPHLNYEVIKVQATDRSNVHNPLTGTFRMLNFPIDQLNDHLLAEATQLSNLRSITFHTPLSWEVYLANYVHISAITLRILDHVSSLTKVTLCADMLHDAIFRSLHSHLCLREVEILLLSSTSSYMLAQIGAVLNRGIPLLAQVEYLKIPLELVSGKLLSSLGILPCLHFLKTTGSPGVLDPGYFFIGCMTYLQVQNPRFFRNLRLLDVRGNVYQQDFFCKEILTNIFPNTKFIKT